MAEVEILRQAGPPPEPAESVELVVTRGSTPGLTPQAGTRFSIGAQPTMIGRDRTCHIVLDDPTVARHHATLYHLHGHHYAISDSESLNGIYVNRRSVRHAELAEGDEIWIGKIRLRFHRTDSSPARPANANTPGALSNGP